MIKWMIQILLLSLFYINAEAAPPAKYAFNPSSFVDYTVYILDKGIKYSVYEYTSKNYDAKLYLETHVNDKIIRKYNVKAHKKYPVVDMETTVCIVNDKPDYRSIKDIYNEVYEKVKDEIPTGGIYKNGNYSIEMSAVGLLQSIQYQMGDDVFKLNEIIQTPMDMPGSTFEPPLGIYCPDYVKQTKIPQLPAAYTLMLESLDGEKFVESITFDKKNKLAATEVTGDDMHELNFFDLKLGLKFQANKLKNTCNHYPVYGHNWDVVYRLDKSLLLTMREDYGYLDNKNAEMNIFKNEDHIRANKLFKTAEGTFVIDVIYNFQTNAPRKIQRSNYNVEQKQIKFEQKVWLGTINSFNQIDFMPSFITTGFSQCFSKSISSIYDVNAKYTPDTAKQNVFQATELKKIRDNFVQTLVKSFGDTVRAQRFQIKNFFQESQMISINFQIMPKASSNYFYHPTPSYDFPAKTKTVSYDNLSETECIGKCETKYYEDEDYCRAVSYNSETKKCKLATEDFKTVDIVLTKQTVIFNRPLRYAVKQAESRQVAAGFVSAFNKGDLNFKVKLDKDINFSNGDINVVTDSHLDDLNVDLTAPGPYSQLYRRRRLNRIDKNQKYVEMYATQETCAQKCYSSNLVSACSTFQYFKNTGKCRLMIGDSNTTEPIPETRMQYEFKPLRAFAQIAGASLPSVTVELGVEEAEHCGYLCLTNDDTRSFITSPSNAFPMVDTCTGFRFANKKCQLTTSEMPLSASNLWRTNANTVYKRSFKMSLGKGVRYLVDSMPEGQHQVSTTDDCMSKCVAKKGKECKLLSMCSDGSGNNVCIIHDDSLDTEKYIFGDKTKATFTCSLYTNTPLNALTERVLDVYKVNTFREMKTVGVVFLTLFMFVIGGAIGFVAMKLIRK